jgi:hypothetical protein
MMARTTTLIAKDGETMTLKTLKARFNDLSGIGFILFPFITGILTLTLVFSATIIGGNARDNLLKTSRIQNTIETIATNINNNKFLPDNHYANVSDFAVTHNADNDTFELIIKNETIGTDETICEFMADSYELNCENNVLVVANAVGKSLVD